MTDLSNPRPRRFWLRTDVPVLVVAILSLIAPYLHAH